MSTVSMKFQFGKAYASATYVVTGDEQLVLTGVENLRPVGYAFARALEGKKLDTAKRFIRHVNQEHNAHEHHRSGRVHLPDLELAGPNR